MGRASYGIYNDRHKRCLHFLSPLQMPFVFLIVGLVVSVIIGTCISAAVASKIVRPVREVKKAMHRVEREIFLKG